MSQTPIQHLDVMERLLELLAEKDREIVALYEQMQPAQVQAASDEAEAKIKGQLLIADSDAATRIRLANPLLREGYSVRTAVDGIEAVEALAAREYDLVLFDYMIPRVPPLDFVTVMRARRPKTKLLVVMQATPAPLLRDDLMQRGVHEILTKPIDMRGLLRVVEMSMNSLAA